MKCWPGDPQGETPPLQCLESISGRIRQQQRLVSLVKNCKVNCEGSFYINIFCSGLRTYYCGYKDKLYIQAHLDS